MRPGWEDVGARARGLGTHLLDDAQLTRLAGAPDLPAVAEGLRAAGMLVPENPAGTTPAALDLAVRRAAAAALRTLARWCGPRAATLAVIFEDEDRRSLRAILRGAAQHAPPEARLAGLIPTPGLPEGPLQELSRQATAATVVALLVAWRHPYASALRPEATSAHPDLLLLEAALNRRFAERALTGARRGGPAAGLLVRYVRDQIDLENAYTALNLAGTDRDARIDELFLPGGRRLPLERFRSTAVAPGAAVAAADLAAVLGEPFRRYAADPGGMEEAALRLQIGALARAQRLAPLGPAPALLFALRLRAQVIVLRRIVWGVALGAPPSLRT